MDFLSVLLVVIIYIGMIGDICISGIIGAPQVVFCLLTLSNLCGLVLDFFAWRVQGMPEYRLANFWINECFYLSGPSTIYLYWLYIYYSLTGVNWLKQRLVPCMRLKTLDNFQAKADKKEVVSTVFLYFMQLKRG